MTVWQASTFGKELMLVMCVKVTGKLEGQGRSFAGFGFFSFCERRVFAFHCTRLLLYTVGNFTVLFLYLTPFPFRAPL